MDTSIIGQRYTNKSFEPPRAAQLVVSPNMIKTIKFIFCLVSLITITGCEELKYTRNEPKTIDLIGHWKLSEVVIVSPEPILTYDKNKPPTIDLFTDGTFVFKNMPRRLINSRFSEMETNLDEINEGKGRWKVERNGEDIFSHWILALDLGSFIDLGVCFQGQSPPYRIFIGLQYEDTGNYTVFKKE